tara:strand:+ start:383 stop:721 length:339 start_codon:yes stop_codon:yes gene_type:complete
MSEENQNQVTEEVEEATEANSNEVVEVEWEEVEELLKVRKRLSEVDLTLSSMMLEFEKKKQSLLTENFRLREYMYQLGEQLRDQKNIDATHTYELKLPKAPGEKGYFIRKEI